MAQGSKSRIVIWTILGIVVVIALVWLITSKKSNTSARPPVNAAAFATKMESRLGRLEGKVAQARADYPGAPAEQWQSIADDIAGVRQILAQMPAITDSKDLQAKVDSVNKVFVGVRKTFKQITGKDASPDSSQ